jgi:hypothetical protein
MIALNEMKIPNQPLLVGAGVVLCVGNEVIGYGTLFGVVVPPEKQLF